MISALEIETLAKLPPQVRSDIARYCEWRGCAYRAILRASEGDEYDRLKRVGLIHYLAAKGYKLKEIRIAAGVDKNTALEILEKRKEPDFRIPTTNWERMATCRR